MLIFNTFTFPKTTVCPICGSSKNYSYTLLPIGETKEGNNCETVPVHVICIKDTNWKYNRKTGVIYTNTKYTP